MWLRLRVQPRNPVARISKGFVWIVEVVERGGGGLTNNNFLLTFFAAAGPGLKTALFGVPTCGANRLARLGFVGFLQAFMLSTCMHAS